MKAIANNKHFSFLDAEFKEEKSSGYTDFGKFNDSFLDQLGYFQLTQISVVLQDSLDMSQEEADEIAYEWASQAKYSNYMEIY